MKNDLILSRRWQKDLEESVLMSAVNSQMVRQNIRIGKYMCKYKNICICKCKHLYICRDVYVCLHIRVCVENVREANITNR